MIGPTYRRPRGALPEYSSGDSTAERSDEELVRPKIVLTGQPLYTPQITDPQEYYKNTRDTHTD